MISVVVALFFKITQQLPEFRFFTDQFTGLYNSGSVPDRQHKALTGTQNTVLQAIQ
jgi:hypothetical protein